MPQETIQVLDVVLRESPSWNYVTASKSFFSTTFGHRGDIGEGLECWRGYYQSLRPTQMGLSLNIATSFFKPVTVIKFVEEFLNLCDTSRPLSDRDRVKIKKALRGVRIETTHQQDQIRRYKITGVTSIPVSQLIFPVDDKGTRQTVVQYFWDKYSYSLKYGSWPCLQAGSDSRPVYLPMEVCKMVEGQRYSKKLNDTQVTCKRPQEREQSIRDMVLHNKYADDRFAQEFGIKVSSDLVLVPAHVLPLPMLKYHDSGSEKTCAPSVRQWNMICKDFSQHPPCQELMAKDLHANGVRRAEKEYKITICITGRTDLYHLQQFLCGRQRDMPQETIQVLDVVFRESQSWNYATVSRSFFSTTFGHRGDIDISATSFFKPVAVIKFVEEFLNLRDTSRPLSDRDHVKIKKALRGVRIETAHQQDQIRRYKITGVTSIPMSQLIFPVDDKGTRQTVVQYFWDEYSYSLKYGSWPCLQAGIIEPLITFPIHPSPFPLGLKHQWSTGLPSMHGGKDDDMANSLIGLLESQQLAQSECPQVPHMKVQFFVSLGGRSLSTQQILEEMTVRELIEYCCQRNGIRETKVIYGVFCGRPLIDEEFLCHYPICRDSTVDLRSRLRGGQFETYTTRFSKPDRDLFYSVALSQTLQNPQIQDKNKKTVKCVWKLKRCTRFWVKLVLVFFTQQHRANICYNGRFEKEDILFEDGSVSLRAGIVGELFSGPGCWLDFNKLATILKELKTSDGYYAPYFNELIGYLEKCPFGENSRHDLAIAFVLNHPAIECFLDRFKQVMLVDAFLFRTLMNRKTPKAHKSIIRKALGKFRVWWHDLCSCPSMKQVLDEGSYVSGGQVFFNALYTNDLSGFFHYSNNYFKHAKKDLKLEEIEAAHSINSQDLLPKVFQLITGFAINNAGSVHVLKTLLDLIGNDLANPCSEHSQDN